MSNCAFHRIGVTLSSIGSVFLLMTIAQKFLGITIFNQLPILPGITFVICGAALIAVARTGEE